MLELLKKYDIYRENKYIILLYFFNVRLPIGLSCNKTNLFYIFQSKKEEEECSD